MNFTNPSQRFYESNSATGQAPYASVSADAVTTGNPAWGAWRHRGADDRHVNLHDRRDGFPDRRLSAYGSDLKLIIDATLGQDDKAGALRPHSDATPLPEAPHGSLFGHPRGHMITVIVLCALLLTMPWWSEGLSRGARSVLNDEVGLLALVQMIFGD